MLGFFLSLDRLNHPSLPYLQHFLITALSSSHVSRQFSFESVQTILFLINVKAASVLDLLKQPSDRLVGMTLTVFGSVLYL